MINRGHFKKTAAQHINGRALKILLKNSLLNVDFFKINCNFALSKLIFNPSDKPMRVSNPIPQTLNDWQLEF